MLEFAQTGDHHSLPASKPAVLFVRIIVLRKTDLSERELQVLHSAAKGLTDKEIAGEMRISHATIKSYWVRIRQKTGGFNRTEAVANVLNQSHPNAESATDRLYMDLARQMAVHGYVDGFVVSSDGKVLLEISSSSQREAAAPGGTLLERLQIHEVEALYDSIQGVCRDLKERVILLTGPCRRGTTVLMQAQLSPTILESGETGVIVSVIRPEVRRIVDGQGFYQSRETSSR